MGLRRLAPSLLIVLAANARAEPGLVAVLPFAADASVEARLRTTLEETIRTIAGEQLSPRGYIVLTGENTLRILGDNNVDIAKTCDASCALEAAREMKAALFIGGSITFVEGQYLAFVRLFDAASGSQLSSVRLEATQVREIRIEFEERAAQFFQSARGTGAPVGGLPAMVVEVPAAPEGTPPGALFVAFDAGADAGWKLLDRALSPVCALPCTRWVPPRSGLVLQRDALRVEDLVNITVPDELGFTPGHALRGTPKTARNGLIWGGGVGVAVGGAMFGGLMIVDSIAHVGFSDDSLNMTLTGVLCAGIGLVTGTIVGLVTNREQAVVFEELAPPSTASRRPEPNETER